MKIKTRSHSTISSIEFVDSGLKIEYKNNHSIQYLAYSDIQKINVHVQVATGTTSKGGTYYYIENIVLVVSYLSNEEMILVTKGNLSLLYEIIKYKKCCPDFKLNVIGDRNFDIPLKIYSKFGIKVSSQGTSSNNLTCSILTTISLYLAYDLGLFNFSNSDIFFHITFSLPFVLILLIPSLIISGFAVYQEYLKYRIRKVLSL